MFLSESERAAAERYYALLDAERALAEWEQWLLARHPETMSTADFYLFRSNALNHLKSIRRLIKETAEAI